jgi:predicted MPP superfamily phosphohydrolase
MYLLNELLMMTPLVLYTGFRLGVLIRSKAGRIVFAIFYLLLIPAFPLAEKLAHGNGPAGTVVLIRAGYDALPFLMYLVLTVVLADLAIGLLRILKIVSVETLRRPGVRAIRFWTMLFVPALIVAAGILNFAHLSISRYAIEVPRRSSSADRIRLVFASDFHLGAVTSPRFLPRFVETVNALEADLILIGGDVLEGDRQGEGVEAFAAHFRRLRAKYGVYGVPGNHEGFGGANRTSFFARAGITLLRDEVKNIEGILYLAGRNVSGRSRPGAARRKTVAELLSATPRDLPVILLDHRPTELEAAAASGVDVQFSGHTHDGQLFPVNLITALQYELSWGYKKKGPTHVFVSCGVQLWGPRVRTAGVSEIMLVDVDFRGGL